MSFVVQSIRGQWLRWKTYAIFQVDHWLNGPTEAEMDAMVQDFSVPAPKHDDGYDGDSDGTDSDAELGHPKDHPGGPVEG